MTSKMETANQNEGVKEETKALTSPAKKASGRRSVFSEKMLSLFSKNRLVFILIGLFLLLIVFYGVSKYVRQEIVKNMTFSMPKIDVSQDNERAALHNNGKKDTSGDMLDEVKKSIDEDKTSSGGVLLGGTPLKVHDKGLKNYGVGNVFKENTSETNNSSEITASNPPLTTHLIEQVSVPKIRKEGYGERKRIVKSREPIKVATGENPFNTIVLENTTNKVRNTPIHKKELVKAAIYGTQVVRNNSSVRIRLLEPMIIDGIIIPANALCSGIAMMGGNRLIIMVTAIKSGTEFIPTKMVVYDSNDMLPGIAYLSDDTKGQIRQQNNQAIDNIDNAVYNIGSATGVVGQVGAGVVSGISRSLRYGGVQRKAGEIELNEGYKVFLKQN
ncbi:hypothetical protein GCM10027035_08010 [Emticicia sediminis]